MVAAVVVVGGIGFVREVELAVHCVERTYYLCNVGRAAEFYYCAVCCGFTFVKELSVAHVLHVIYVSSGAFELPDVVGAQAFVGAAPTRVAVNYVEEHGRVVVLVVVLQEPYAVVTVGEAPVAVGLECFCGRF